MPFTAAEIAERLGGEVLGDGATPLTGLAPASSAKTGDLTFAENETYLARAEQSAASAILVEGNFTWKQKVLIRVPKVRIAFAKVLPLFFHEVVFKPGVHPTAVIGGSTHIDPTAHIGPFCTIGEGTSVAARVVLEGGNHVGANCALGEDAHLFPNVTVYSQTQIGKRVRIHSGSVIGADGFAYIFDEGAHLKVPQVGSTVIGDDVEIGANVTIDRGALGATVIGKGTKIDNLVMIAHNVVIGEHCLVISQVGIAGSTRLGSYVTLAGQAGLAGHLKIGDRVTIAAKSGVMHDIKDGEKWLGIPAQPDRQMKRQMIILQQLPDLVRRINRLEKKLNPAPSQPLAGESETSHPASP
jgi:UDP-3-O-[3-hydroxymyristoyl] glucosamine N-acyltransferase